jgi:beta-glucosidase
VSPRHAHIPSGHLLDDGYDDRGSFQWSPLDNFEWTLGNRPTFGVVAVDRITFARMKKPSPKWFAQSVRNFFTTT